MAASFFRLFLLALLLVLPTRAIGEGLPAIEHFSPQGTVKKVRQATARFSQPMVSFGDPRLSDPFEVDCSGGIEGKGRWADGRNWVFDFAEDLPAGVACTFALKPSLRSLSGEVVTGPRKFTFSSGGPSIVRSVPFEGNPSIDENQAFLLLLDAEAGEESILANVSFSVAGIKEAVGVKIVKGEDRKTLIESGPARGWVRLPYPVAGRETVLEFRRKEKAADDARIVVLMARQSFPPEAEVFLRWGNGIRSVTGVATAETKTLAFKTRPAFTVRFVCDRERKGAACIPLLPMTLRFSAPVARATASRMVLRGPAGSAYKAVIPGEDDGRDSFVHGVAFPGPFPEKSKFRVEIPPDLKDDAGRLPINRDKFPLVVETDAYPALAKFAAPFGIVEWNGDAALPVTVRNVEIQAKTRMLEILDRKPDTGNQVKEGALEKAIEAGERLNSLAPDSLKQTGERDLARMKGRLHELRAGREDRIVHWLRNVAKAQSDQERRGTSLLVGSGDVTEFAVPKPGGEKAFEVVGIPFRKPGFYIVEIESKKLGRSLLDRGDPMYVPAAVLVTNLSAHFKQGRESSLVWVTSLDKGEPVAEAEVAVRDPDSGNILWHGKTDAQGVARIRQALPKLRKSAGGWEYHGGYFVTARQGDDLTFVFSNWNQGIEPYRFNLPTTYRPDPTIGHTVFDRTLFRAGETVHMKHFLRRHSLDGLFQVGERQLPKGILLRHMGSEERYEMPLKWAPDGSAEGEWAIPKGAKLGQYGVFLLYREPGVKEAQKAPGGSEDGDEETSVPFRGERQTGSFRVEEYRVPLMKGTVSATGGPIVDARDVELDLLVSYLSGGGAGGAAVRLRTDLQPRNVSFPGYGEFLFANGRVVEGISREEPGYFAGEEEESGEDAEDRPDVGNAAGRKPPIRTKELLLDTSGALRTKVSDLGRFPAPRDLVAELEFSDPNGEVQTVSTRIPLWPSRVLLGIKPDSWAASRESFKFQVVALDLSGKPARGATVSVDLFQRKTYSHRKRLLGGMYAYDHSREDRKIGGICEGTTDDKGLLICESKSPVSGNVLLQASAKDAGGKIAYAHRDVWVAGQEDWWFDVSDNDRIDLLPEKKRYEPGESAVFQVRMPFREATALVTVEREGIAEVFLRKLSGKNPVIEVPVKPYYAPNVYVSVLCVRGRVAGVAPTATIDLGRPAFKLGVAEISVGWKVHEVKVDVSPEREVYRTREKGKVTIRAMRAVGDLLPKGSEALVAVVDEGLLELASNGSWNLLEAMMGRRSYEVATSTAQMHVVGKRHFGLKAIPQGGGGGRQAARELFDTLLFWKARVPLDGKGEARVEIPLNDSLTSFRIVAVVSGGAEFFGTGEASIRTTREVMVLSGLPPLVREGDRFRAGFTVRNASDRALEVRTSAILSRGAKKESLDPVTVSLGPGEARDVGWKVRVPVGADPLEWEVTASAGEGFSDRIRVRQRVIPAVPVRAIQATLTQLTGPLEMKVASPPDAIPGRGGISVDLRGRLSDGLGGVVRYMTDYPYTCMEQKVSRAIALRDSDLWKSIMADLPSYLDRDGLAKYFPGMSLGSDALTAYILSVAGEAGRQIPGIARERMMAGLQGFIEGKVIRHGSLSTADLSLRKMSALEALSRYGAGKPSHLDSITVEPNLWPTSGVIDWMNVLSRIKEIPGREKLLAEAEGALRLRMNFQGTSMGFSTERTDFLWWLMVSGDVNAVRAILALQERPGWGEEIPRMVRGALGRQHSGAWNTTVANAWGVLAMEKFSRKYELETVSGTTSAELGSTRRAVDWEKAAQGGSVLLPWPKGKEKEKEKGTLKLAHRGGGRPWATVQSLAAVPLKKPFSSGYSVKKTIAPVQQKVAGLWSRGDVVRVTLEVEAQSDMTWVVVNDPILAGGTILGSGLGRDSRLLVRGEKREGLAWPAFTERSFDAFRAYYEFVPKGRWTVEYTVRLNNGGTFLLPSTRVEALYSPEMFGEIPNRAFVVAP